MQDMQTKGYSTFTMTSPDCPLYTTATISIDYSTRPAIFADGKWDHSVSISFTHYPRHLGNTEAIWRGFASESIDSILMTLSLEAMGKVPRYSE